LSGKTRTSPAILVSHQVSADYYTRMEQGRVPNPSGAVLDALAGALRLDGDETRHLHRLARLRLTAAPTPRRQTRPQHVRSMFQRLLVELVDVPSVVMGRRLDMLAWNRAAWALFGDYRAAFVPADPAWTDARRIRSFSGARRPPDLLPPCQ
jgi:hypothetical protein